MTLTDHDGYSENYLENTELNRGIFLSFSSGDYMPGIFLIPSKIAEAIKLPAVSGVRPPAYLDWMKKGKLSDNMYNFVHIVFMGSDT